MNKEMYERMESQYRQALKENEERTKKHQKREKIKEKILSVFIGSFIVLATCLLLLASGNMQKKAIDSCQAKGHNYNYCINKAG